MPVLSVLTATIGGIAAYQFSQKPGVSTSDVTDVAISVVNVLPVSHVATATATATGPYESVVESAFTPVLPDKVVALPHVATVSTSHSISMSQHLTYPVSTAQYPGHGTTATSRAGDIRRKTARRQAVATSPADRTNGHFHPAKSALATMDEDRVRFLASLYRAYGRPDGNTPTDKNSLPTEEDDLQAVFGEVPCWIQNHILIAKMQMNASPAQRKDYHAMLERVVYEAHALLKSLLVQGIYRISEAVANRFGSTHNDPLEYPSEQAYLNHVMQWKAHFSTDGKKTEPKKAEPKKAESVNSGNDFDELIRSSVRNHEVAKLSKETKNVLWRDAWQLKGQHQDEDLINGPNKLLAHHFATRFNLTFEEATYLVADMGKLTRTGSTPWMPPKATGPPVKDIDLKEKMCEHFPDDPQCKH